MKRSMLLVYGATSLVSALSAWRLLPSGLYSLAAAAALIAGLARASAVDWGEGIFNNPSNPAGNEAGGLAIVASWLAFLAWRARPGANELDRN